MKIQLNTDSHIVGSEALTVDVEKKITSALKRYAERITRIEVHLSDMNAAKTGPDEKRCVIEARVAGLQPTSVSHQAPTVSLAIDGAREKIVAALGTTFGKRDTVRHEQIAPAADEPD